MLDAYDAIERRDEEKMLQCVEVVLEKETQNLDALRNRAVYYMNHNRPADALADVDAALACAPKDVESLLLRCAVRLNLGFENGQWKIASACWRLNRATDVRDEC